MLPYVEDYTRKRAIPYLLGKEQIQTPILIASIGPKRIIIGFFKRIIITKISRNGKDLSIIVNSARRPLRRR